MWQALGTNRIEGSEISFFLLSLSPAVWAQALTPSLNLNWKRKAPLGYENPNMIKQMEQVVGSIYDH